MNFDVAGHLGAAERSVSSRERDGQPCSAVTLSRSFATSVEDLWDALSNGDRIPAWFLPISGDLRLGGRFQFEGNADGEITDCEPPTRLAVTWEFGEMMSWVEVRCAGGGAGRARITITHIAPLSEHWDQYGPGATGVGWEMGLVGLALHLADPAARKPDPAEFAAPADGKDMLAGSSEAWGEAAVEAGTDHDAARAAARRTTAFYTGVPVEEG